jgi:rSAM/selenodomain-associated transferase 2
MTPSLSIVIPVLNEEPRITSALRALAPLRDQGHEVLVCDGGSTDATLARCAGLADAVLHSPPGRARQMNAGAAAARGEVLLFLHADTTLPGDAPAAIARALAQGAVWGRFDVHIEGRARMLPVIAAFMNRRSRWTGIATGDQAMFVRREVFDSVGGFLDQPLMEDIELSRRLCRLGHPPACLRQRVRTSGRRWDERGAWRTILLMWRLRWRYWRGTPAETLARMYR